MRRFRHFAAAVAIALGAFGCARGGPWSYKPSAENLRAREAFQDAKFGLFFPWGVFSALGLGEPAIEGGEMSVAQCELLASEFKPSRFDAEMWVKTAKAAGARYIVFTARHRDGFAMFDSGKTDWDIVNRSPFKRDPLKELAAECRRQGLRLFINYSRIDLLRAPDDWDASLDAADGQIAELLKGYGPLGGIRLEGMRAKPDADWRNETTYRLIHRLQPAALVGNDHAGPPIDGEDFQIANKGATDQETGELPVEICDTINRSRGYNQADRDFKSLRELMHSMIRAAGAGSNFLLAAGPRGDGTIQPEFAERLKEIGQWMKANGESLYGTRAGPVAAGEWSVCTQKKEKVFVHYLADRGGKISIPASAGELGRAYLFSSGASIDFAAAGDAYEIDIPQRIIHPIDTIIVLEMRPGGTGMEP